MEYNYSYPVDNNYSYPVNDRFYDGILNIDSEVFIQKTNGAESDTLPIPRHSVAWELFKSLMFSNNDKQLYQESFILVHRNLQLVGYLSFVPVTEEFGERVASQAGKSAVCLTEQDILAGYKKKEAFDVFIMSIAVLPDHQNKGIEKELIQRLFAFLSDKIQTGCRLRRLHIYAYTDSWADLLVAAGFTFSKKNIKYTDSSAVVEHMQYKYDDFSKTNLYLFVPLFFETSLDKFNTGNKDNYIKQIEYVSQNEFRREISGRIKRFKMQHELRYELLLVDDADCNPILDNNENPIVKEFNLYFTYYKDFCVAILVFEDLSIDPTFLLSQSSMNELCLIRFTNKNGTVEEKRSFTNFVADQLSIQSNDVRQAGTIRSMTSLVEKPTETHLAFMMACECYTESEYMTARLNNRADFYQKANIDHSQYEYYQLYVSERNAVIVLTHPGDNRLREESTIIFIIELITLQLCAISSIYNETIDSLGKTTYSESQTKLLSQRFNNAALLWNVNNFVFLGAKKEFEIITNEFEIPHLKKECQLNLNILERISLVESQRHTEIVILMIITGLTALLALLISGYVAFVQIGLETIMILGVGILVVAVFVVIGICYMQKKKYQK